MKEQQPVLESNKEITASVILQPFRSFFKEIIKEAVQEMNMKTQTPEDREFVHKNRAMEILDCKTSSMYYKALNWGKMNKMEVEAKAGKRKTSDLIELAKHYPWE